VITKFLEVRDRATTIPVLAIKITKDSSPIASYAGFGETGSILLIHLNKPDVQYDPYAWTLLNGRTMRGAHIYIEQLWDTLEEGNVVDVEYLTGETQAPKLPEIGHARG
jgi:hypothetical protein